MPVSLGHRSDGSGRCFTTTNWSLVLAAKQKGSREADAALDRLCRFYRLPIYAFILRDGYQAHDAEDLTQGFFASLLVDDFLSAVDRSKGKFRAYLLVRLKHFLSNEKRRSKAQKRGGKSTIVSMDAESADKQRLQIAASVPSPEQIFQQQWARTLLDSTVDCLRVKYVAEGKEGLFDGLKAYLIRDDEATGYAELGKKLGKTEAALKMAKLRMKEEWEQLLRAEIARTVTTAEEVEDELRALFGAFTL